MTKIHAGDKVIRDTATVNQGKVHLGDFAPCFRARRRQSVRDTATVNQGKVHLGDDAPVFVRAGDKVVRDTSDRERGQRAPRGTCRAGAFVARRPDARSMLPAGTHALPRAN